MKLKNNSVQNCKRIAEKYSYKTQIIRVNNEIGFLSVFDNFLKSPYPNHFTSKIATIKYLQKIFND